MIHAVDGNRILAAFLGTGRTRGLGGRITAVDPRAASASHEAEHVQNSPAVSNYAQPVDTFESRRGASEAGRGAGRTGTSAISGQELSEEEQAQLRKLKKRDAEVRRHEQAHKAAAGSTASGGPSFEYETGPDGKRYAVGGEVQIDTSQVSGDAQATIDKMQQVRRAALAPGNPSAQDRAVAAQAQAAERKAQAELRKERAGSTSGGASKPTSGQTPQSLSDASDVQPRENPLSTGGSAESGRLVTHQAIAGDQFGRFDGAAPAGAPVSVPGAMQGRPEVGSILDLVA